MSKKLDNNCEHVTTNPVGKYSPLPTLPPKAISGHDVDVTTSSATDGTFISCFFV